MTVDPITREWLLYYPAWEALVEKVGQHDPRTICPRSIHGSLLAYDRDRLAAWLYSEGHGDAFAEATAVLDDLLLMAKGGARPRITAELGIACPEAVAHTGLRAAFRARPARTDDERQSRAWELPAMPGQMP